MCGMYDRVKIDSSIDLPEWERDDYEYGWQSKEIQFSPTLALFKISEDGRLLRKHTGKETVDVWEGFFEEHGYRDHTEMLLDENAPEDRPDLPVVETVDEWWTDEEYHGSFEFHTSIQENVVMEEERGGLTIPQEYEVDEWWSYEARFTDGDLQDIVLLEMKER